MIKEIPFNNIKHFGQINMLDRPLFNISWILGRFCNYKCSYCWPYANSDKLDFQSIDVYKRTVDEIKRQARLNGFNEFHWSFSGGEPTTFKQLLELTRHLDEMESSYQSIHMTTNLSPSINWWKSWANAVSMLQRKSITASYHAEFAKESEFGDKCLKLMDEFVYVTVNQVMVPEQFFELYERCERLHKRGINVTLKPQSNETASAIVDGYTPEMINIMKQGFPQKAFDENIYQIRLNDGGQDYLFDQAERFNAFGFNSFKGWDCNSGYQSLVIRGNEVRRGYSCREEPIGTLDSFQLFAKPMPCVTERCVSSADSKIPKIKNV
jgi:organic radical activating enzyme